MLTDDDFMKFELVEESGVLTIFGTYPRQSKSKLRETLKRCLGKASTGFSVLRLAKRLARVQAPECLDDPETTSLSNPERHHGKLHTLKQSNRNFIPHCSSLPDALMMEV